MLLARLSPGLALQELGYEPGYLMQGPNRDTGQLSIGKRKNKSTQHAGDGLVGQVALEFITVSQRCRIPLPAHAVGKLLHQARFAYPCFSADECQAASTCLC